MRTQPTKSHPHLPRLVNPLRQSCPPSDFTINALFYNLNAGAVEDLTGRGLADLRAGVLRTPLPAAETFLDGVRAERGPGFSWTSRLGYRACAQCVQLQRALPKPDCHE